MKNIKLIVLSLLLLQINQVFSQDFEVSPAVLKYTIDPFETSKKVVTITNHSNKLTIFKLTYSDFILSSDGKIKPVAAKTTENTCVDWLMSNNNIFEVKPNESYQLVLSMQVPLEDYKARWGYIFVQTSKEQTSFSVDKESAKTGINLQARIAIEVTRIPKTKQQNKVKINSLEELEEEGKEEKDKNSRVFTVVIENKGFDIHECEVFFVASDLSNAEQYEFERIKIKSYPGFPRKVTFTLPHTLPKGEYSFVALLDYGNKETLEGTRLNKSLFIIK